MSILPPPDKKVIAETRSQMLKSCDEEEVNKVASKACIIQNIIRVIQS